MSLLKEAGYILRAEKQLERSKQEDFEQAMDLRKDCIDLLEKFGKKFKRGKGIFQLIAY